MPNHNNPGLCGGGGDVDDGGVGGGESGGGTKSKKRGELMPHSSAAAAFLERCSMRNYVSPRQAAALLYFSRNQGIFFSCGRAEMPIRKALEVLERVQAKLTGRDYAKVGRGSVAFL